MKRQWSKCMANSLPEQEPLKKWAVTVELCRGSNHLQMSCFYRQGFYIYVFLSVCVMYFIQSQRGEPFHALACVIRAFQRCPLPVKCSKIGVLSISQLTQSVLPCPNLFYTCLWHQIRSKITFEFN